VNNRVIYIGIFAAIVLFATMYLSTEENAGEGKVQQHSPIATPATVDTVTGDSTADSYDSLQATVYSGIEKNEDLKKGNSVLKHQLKLLENKFEQFKSETLHNASDTENTLELTEESTTKPTKEPKTKLVEQVVLYKPKSTNVAPKSNFQFGNGYSLSEGLGFKKSGDNLQSRASRAFDKNDPNSGWIMPIESQYSTVSGVKANVAQGNKNEKPSLYPAMTISDNSILYDTTALTYLVGRIPVGGRVPDPFPVKMVVGKEVLIANGHDLPGIEGMFFSGYATGDMNLRCVRAEMNSYTFVFDDGRQVSFRETPRTGKGNQEPMAYISDRYGLPCVMGSFVSNVTEFLSIQAGLSGLTAAGEAYAAAQVTTGVNGIGGSQSTVTGDNGKYALGKVVSGAFGDISKWMLERQENSFDAVVVPSGTKVSLHLNRDILIDYDEAARRVDYRYLVNNGNLD